MSFQVVVLFVPVFLGLMGFAVDLGRLYSARSDLKTAANAIAIGAAARLNGTTGALESAQIGGRYAIDASAGPANRYDFGGLRIGQSTGSFSSDEPQLAYFDNAAAALGAEGASGGDAGGATARYVRVTVRGEAPLVFWRFLPLAQEGKLNLAAEAVAGVSAPLCQACGIEPVAVQAISQDDTTNFGFLPGIRYTLGYLCTGGATPAPLATTVARVPYVILNRYNDGAQILSAESTQLYRIGAGGLPSYSDTNFSCIRANAEETIWVNAAPGACNQTASPQVTALLCGLSARFDPTTPAICNAIAESDAVLSANSVDTDIADIEDYTAYSGTGRRVITVPIVDQAATTTMLVLGFRQFLIEPALNNVTINAADQNGRIAALYLGSVMPVRAGRIDGCTIASGPGKVVLHR